MDEEGRHEAQRPDLYVYEAQRLYLRIKNLVVDEQVLLFSRKDYSCFVKVSRHLYILLPR